MGTTGSQGFSRTHARRLLKMVAGGVAFFTVLLVVVQVLLVRGGMAPDPSFYKFYPIMAGLGAVFGFERWWAYEQGGVNPFHDR